jgi:protoporphyrin/coproporphyrin ferrochelatase
MGTAVLLMNYGGPTKAEECRPYLQNIFMDPDLIPIPGLIRPLVAGIVAKRRAPKLQKIYEAMGRYSPTLEETTAQSGALEKALGEGFSCFVGMRYWKPSIEEAVGAIVRGGHGRLVLLPLYPHESRSTTGSSVNEARRALGAARYRGEVLEVRSFWDEPGYLEALTSQVVSALAGAGAGTRVLFSAHGLPLSVARRDLYPGQVAATVQEVSRRLGLALDPIAIPGHVPEIDPSPGTRRPALGTSVRASLAWQSKVGPMKWLEPSVEDVLGRWSREGAKDIVLVPVSFVNEHSETLYELDVLYGGIARELGLGVRRLPTLGVTRGFISGLASRVRAACGEA